jgi:methionyl aminopeptidase
MIIIKTQKEIAVMRRGGKRLGEIMEELGKMAVSGQNTHEIDERARALVFEFGGVPIFEGFGDPQNPYPGAVCASINSEIVHGIPRKDRVLKDGDILKIDIGMKYEGMITDMARTFAVGRITPAAHRLMKATWECLNTGISKIRAGARLSDYGIAVDSCARSYGFSTIRELVGHGVGRELHEEPQIPNYKISGKQDIILKEGMTIALEPMINEGTGNIKLMKDGWTYATADGKLSAHFEDTVVVKKGGCEILTR